MLRVRLASCLLVLTATLITACATISSNTPNATVLRFYHAIAAQDTDLALQQLIPPADSFDRNKQRMAIQEVGETMDKNQGLANVEILQGNLTQHGTHANVRAKVNFNNGQSKIDDIKLRQQDNIWKIVL